MAQQARRNELNLLLFDVAGSASAVTADGADGQPSEHRGADTREGTDTRASNQAAFERMIKGEYRDAFSERVQQIIDSRFKETKALKARMDAVSPVLDKLAARYGVKAGDPDALLKALAADGASVAAEQGSRGAAAEALENTRPSAGAADTSDQDQTTAPQNKADMRGHEAASRTIGDWVRQGEALRRMYPWFNLTAEAANPYTGRQFLSLLKSHVPVRAAFELIHRDQLLESAMRYTAQQVRRKTVEDIRTRGLRPEENGAHGQGASLTKRDIRSLTREERDKIARRAARGERITF